MTLTEPKTAYIFLDEGGNLDFSPSGSRYFTLTGVLKYRPFRLYAALTELRFDLIENGLDIEYFHASEDRQPIRDLVFKIICNHIDSFIVDSIIIEKRQTNISLRNDHEFYPQMLGNLLQNIVEKLDRKQTSEVIVITDKIPVNRKRHLVEKSVKHTLKLMLSNTIPYRIMHHDSKSTTGLQIADYFNWAIFRAWERKDRRSFDLVQKAIRSQIEICINEDDQPS